MSHDVFISYSSKDKAAADQICRKLEAAGIRCWIAMRDIPGGSTWTREIPKAINQARVVVLVFSGDANKSPQVEREVQLSIDQGRTLIPFRLDDSLPTESFAFFLSGIHWLDAWTPPMEEHIKKLIHQIKAIIGDRDETAIVSKVLHPVMKPHPEPAVKHKHLSLWLLACCILVIAGSGWMIFAGKEKNVNKNETNVSTYIKDKKFLIDGSKGEVVLPIADLRLNYDLTVKFKIANITQNTDVGVSVEIRKGMGDVGPGRVIFNVIDQPAWGMIVFDKKVWRYAEYMPQTEGLISKDGKLNVATLMVRGNMCKVYSNGAFLGNLVISDLPLPGRVSFVADINNFNQDKVRPGRQAEIVIDEIQLRDF